MPKSDSKINQTPLSPSRRRFLGAVLGSAVIAVPGAAYGHFIGIDDLEIVRRSVSIPKWPKSRSPLRVGYLSDFHCDCEHALDRIHRSVDMLLSEKPDVVLLGGDYITHDYQRWAPPCISALTPLLAARLGVYAVLGNHDWWSCGSSLLAKLINRTGIELMTNSALPLDSGRSVWIVGLDDRLADKSDVRYALIGVPNDVVKLLLIHEPDYADEAPPGFALQMSGHSHGGQIRVFNQALITPGLGRKYIEGLETALNHPVYTSRGVGVVGPQMRIACRPEVTILTLGSV